MPRWPQRTVEERFWTHVNRTDDCWLWTAGTNSSGYGSFKKDGRMVSAHRYAYELLVGPIPESHELDHRHTCSKRCVNPDHVRPATHKQNMENRAGARSGSASGVRGVTWYKNYGQWHAELGHHGKNVHVGYFSTIEDAEAAVIAKRNELFTHNDVDRELA